jgi:hypothetical protein
MQTALRANRGLALNLIEKIVLSYVGLIGAMGMLVAICNTPYFDQKYGVEDGLLEWLQFFGLMTIAAISWWRIVTLGRHVHWQGVVVLLLTAWLFTFVSGEEISWGQRLFDWTAPEFFVENNRQFETNLHNLTWNGINLNKLIFGKGLAVFLLLYGLVLTPLYHRYHYAWVDRVLLPIPRLYQLLALVVIAVSVEVVLKHFSDAVRRGELIEFAGVFVVLLIVLYPANRHALKLP